MPSYCVRATKFLPARFHRDTCHHLASRYTPRKIPAYWTVGRVRDHVLRAGHRALRLREDHLHRSGGHRRKQVSGGAMRCVIEGWPFAGILLVGVFQR